MVKKRCRYENAGRIKSIFTVNFREPEEILSILNTFKGNEVMECHLAELYCKMQTILVGYQFTKPEKKDVLNFAVYGN